MKKAVKFLVEHAAAGLLLDPGLRKTSITLAAITFLKRQGLVSKVLVIAPLRVCYLVWPAEGQKWLDFQGLRIAVLHGKDKDKVLERDDADVYVINPAGLDWLYGAVGKLVDQKRWRRLGFDTLVVDELSGFKHPKSKRFKLTKQVLGTFQRRWGLTGSPAANGLEGLFGQCYILDQGNALGQYITHYRSKFFNPPTYGFKWTIKDGAEEQIYARLKPLALRMAAEDYLELPHLLENTIRVDLPEKVRRVYDELENELITLLTKKTMIIAANAAVATNKCRQVAAGAVYLDSEPGPKAVASVKRPWKELHETKLDALEELVDSLQGKPLLVGYEFKHDLERLLKRFGKDVPYLGGGTSMKATQEIADRWNSGETPLLLAHPQAAGHGLNLQGSSCQHVCWFTPTWDYELYDQFIRRVYRSGTKAFAVTVHSIVARDTVDELVLMSLRSKKKGQAALFDALRTLKRRR